MMFQNEKYLTVIFKLSLYIWIHPQIIMHNSELAIWVPIYNNTFSQLKGKKIVLFTYKVIDLHYCIFDKTDGFCTIYCRYFNILLRACFNISQITTYVYIFYVQQWKSQTFFFIFILDHGQRLQILSLPMFHERWV